MREFEEFRIEGKANKLNKRIKGSPVRGNTILQAMRTHTSDSLSHRGAIKSLQNPMDVSIEISHSVAGGFGSVTKPLPGTSSQSPRDYKK